MSVLRAVSWAYRKARTLRFHTHFCTRQETIGHHSHGVAVIVSLVYPDASADLLRAAVLHDLGEGEWGDMPGHTKRELGIREAVAVLEEREMRRNGVEMPTLNAEEHRRLKFADNAHGALFSMEELSRGNRELLGPFRNYVEWMEKEPMHLLGEQELFEMIRRRFFRHSTEGVRDEVFEF